MNKNLITNNKNANGDIYCRKRSAPHPVLLDFQQKKQKQTRCFPRTPPSSPITNPNKELCPPLPIYEEQLIFFSATRTAQTVTYRNENSYPTPSPIAMSPNPNSELAPPPTVMPLNPTAEPVQGPTLLPLNQSFS